MSVFRLNEKHPLYEKLNEIFSLMDEAKIKIEIDCGVIVVTHDDKKYKMLDLEKSYYSNYSGIWSLPAEMEYKLCYEKEENDNL